MFSSTIALFVMIVASFLLGYIIRGWSKPRSPRSSKSATE
jgi:hypothetical protein